MLMHTRTFLPLSLLTLNNSLCSSGRRQPDGINAHVLTFCYIGQNEELVAP